MDDETKNSGNTFAKLVEQLTITGHYPGFQPSPNFETNAGTVNVKVVGPMVGMQEVDGNAFRYIRATEIESVCPHKDGSIIRTKTGDFHRSSAVPTAIAYEIRRAEGK